MAAINHETLQFEVSGMTVLHPYLRDCNLDAELLVEALTQTPIGREFDAGTVELAAVAEALRQGRAKLDRLNAEIKHKSAEVRVLRKTINELKPQVVDKSVEVDINTILDMDEDVTELITKYSMATPEALTAAISDASDRVRGVLTFIGIHLMELDLPLEDNPAFVNGYTAAEDYCEL